MSRQLSVTVALREIKEKTEINISEMARQARLGRKKIRDLLNGEKPNFNMRTWEWENLDHFLHLHGRSLSIMPLFEPPRFFDLLTKFSTDITTFVSAYNRPQQSDFSKWDILSYLEVSEEFRVSTSIQCGLSYVNIPAGKATYSIPRELSQSLKGAPSVLMAIGSPRMSLMSEAVFRKVTAGSKLDLGFVWWDKRPTLSSQFSRARNAISDPQLRADLQSKGEYGSVLQLNGMDYACLPTGDKYFSYGVVLARRLGDTILFSVAGLNGPGTLGTTMAISELDISALMGTGAESPLVLGLFEVELKASLASSLYDNRQVIGQRLVAQY